MCLGHALIGTFLKGRNDLVSRGLVHWLSFNGLAQVLKLLKSYGSGLSELREFFLKIVEV